MSFNRSPALESQPTTSRRSDDPQYSDDPEFQRFTTQLSDKLFSLTSNTNQLDRQISLLGTKRETERVRERIHNLVEETGAAFKEVGEGLKRISAWPDLGPSQKYTQGKLNREFNETLTLFQVQQRNAIEKQKATRAAIEQEESSQQGGRESGQQMDLLQQQEQARLAPQSEVDFQSNLIVERETEIRQIEQSVNELNELFRDVATMVHEQGDQLDTIGDHVDNTLTDTRAADGELRQANKYQKKARGKMFCLLLIIAVILLVVVLAVAI